MNITIPKPIITSGKATRPPKTAEPVGWSERSELQQTQISATSVGVRFAHSNLRATGFYLSCS